MTTSGSTLPRSIDAPDPTRRCAVLYVVLHAHDLERPASRHILEGIAGVSVGRGDEARVARTVVAGEPWLDIRLADARVSSSHLRIVRAMHRWAAEDVGSRNGTFVNGEPIKRAVLLGGDVIEVGNTFLQFAEAAALATDTADVTVRADAGLPGLATILPELARTFARLELAARARETVLVRGESGTGKELVAHAIHELSGRDGAFVAVNCGALPESMVEAELFGHKRGAFSGAAGERTGLVRSASGGTLFLDEIGDLRLGSQAALLRVLQEQQVTPIGSDAPLAVDLRVVCATHRPLDELVDSGDFRGDLLARLRGFVVELPPLRARLADLGLVIGALVRKHAGAGAPTPALSGAAARVLFAYAWPYNVRELEKCLTTAMALAAGGPIRVEHLPDALRALASAGVVAGVAAANTGPITGPGSGGDADDGDDEASGGPAGAADAPGVGEARRARLVRLMREYQGNVAAVARVLGKGRTQIHRWLERYGIDPDEYRS